MVGIDLIPLGGMSTAPINIRSAIGLSWLFGELQRTGANLLRWTFTLGRPPQAPPPRWPAAGTVAIVLTVAVIVAAMFFVDAAASTWARGLPQWLTGPADEITNFGQSGWFLYPLAFILLFLAAVASPKLPRFAQETLALFAARTGFLFTAIAAPSLFDTIVKRLIGRARPYVGPHDNPFHYVPFAWDPEYASMPSGHATTAAAAAIAFGAIWPRLRPVMWPYALIIMATRVIIDVHHPSDVLAGALVGVVGAFLVRRWFAARGMAFSATDLRALPGPSWQRLKDVAATIVGKTRAPGD
jgi:membrane-associated phospholipid phosphatase